MASGEFLSWATKLRHFSNEGISQRARTKSSLTKPSVTMTWARELMSATLVPGRSFKCCSASMCGVRTRSMRRGSATISFAPWRRRRFICDANTGWPSVGFAPITKMTSAFITESKFCVPADSPSVFLRP